MNENSAGMNKNSAGMNQNSSDFIHGYSSREASSQSSQTKEPDKKANSLVWVVLIVLILALTALVSYYFGFSGIFDSQTPTLVPVSTPTLLTNVGESKQYSDAQGKYSFSYPGELDLQTYEDEVVSVSMWGPTQKGGSEFYDGVSVSFKKGSMGGKTLKNFVDGKYNDFKEVFETSMPLLETVAEKNGYKFHVKGYVEADYYYVELSGGPPVGEASEYLEIVDATKDPTSKGFASIVEQILFSLKIN